MAHIFGSQFPLGVHHQVEPRPSIIHRAAAKGGLKRPAESLRRFKPAVKRDINDPLIGMDKVEITQIAERIGTYETSILPYEDCCTVFTPRHPVTKPKLEKVLAAQKKMPVDELVEKAMAGVETIEIDPDFEI